jgi:hypothetical protein
MIINKSVNIKGHPRNISYYKDIGIIIGVRQTLDIDPKLLSYGSTIVIECGCDNCGIIKKMQFREYHSYTNGLLDKYFCISCKSIKSKNTCLEKYGFDNPMKSNIIKDILKKSLFDKYGVDHYSKTDEYKVKYKESCINKYGVDNASKSDSIKQLISNIKFKNLNSINKYKDILSDEYDIIEYNNTGVNIKSRVSNGIGVNRNFRILHKKCNSEFEIFIGTISDRIRNKNIICTNCNPIDTMVSSGEIELKNLISSTGLSIIENSYDIIPPLSLDIYLPELNIAFEFNGVYWHSELHKHKNYHINKTKECNKIGIELVHIWEDDWHNKYDIIKSMILNKIGKTTNKVYARKCQVREIVDIHIVREFLDNNHIQGYSSSSIKLGLYHNNELVSLMIFDKKRIKIELVRFCNKLNTNVIGGSSKLFKYYIDNYNCNNIVSFSDISFFNGNMYDKLGFRFTSITKPNFWWIKGGISNHRFNFTKTPLSKSDSDLTESGVMNDLGIYRIWGCGFKKWMWERPNIQ